MSGLAFTCKHSNSCSLTQGAAMPHFFAKPSKFFAPCVDADEGYAAALGGAPLRRPNRRPSRPGRHGSKPGKLNARARLSSTINTLPRAVNRLPFNARRHHSLSP